MPPYEQTDHISLINPIPCVGGFDEDGVSPGKMTADLFVENVLIIEVKACKTLIQEHIAQVFGYLRASRVEHGLLINFGSPILEIKKYILQAET